MIGKKLRFTVLQRDNHTCQYCGKKAPYTVIEIDHVIPKCKGGKDTLENLVASCYDCNKGKGKDDYMPHTPENLYKEKIKELNYKLRCYFYEQRNKNNMGMIGDNEKILLSIYVKESINGEGGWIQYLDFLEENKGGFDYKYHEKLFMEGGDFCDKILNITSHFVGQELDEMIEEVYDDSNRNRDTSEGPDFSGKLNYNLTENLYDEGRGIKDYVLRKYTLFPKILQNGKAKIY